MQGPCKEGKLFPFPTPHPLRCSPVEGEACPSLDCDLGLTVITRKMVPITGRASASFSSMLKL